MNATFRVDDTKFGSLDVCEEDVFFFPQGLIGFEDCQRWVLLQDDQADRVGWLQSLDRPAVSLAVVSPRQFVIGYRVRLTSRQLQVIDVQKSDRIYVLVTVSRDEQRRTANLKAPLVINLDRQLGAQLVTRDDQPIQLDLQPLDSELRRSA